MAFLIFPPSLTQHADPYLDQQWNNISTSYTSNLASLHGSSANSKNLLAIMLFYITPTMNSSNSVSFALSNISAEH